MAVFVLSAIAEWNAWVQGRMGEIDEKLINK
jgi:hypothetical protein